MTASIVAEVKLKTDSVAKSVSGVSSKIRGLASSTGSVFRGVLGAEAVRKGFELAADGARALVGEVGKVRQAGSDLQQSAGAVETVFGKYTASIKRSSGQAADSLGLSKNAYNELAVVLGSQLKNQGIKDYAGSTQDLIKRGGDLAAVFGGPTKDAVEAISAVMRGETDPIERYGVSMNQTAVNAELAARGQSHLKGEALKQATAQARLAILFRQTRQAQGQFAAQSGTLAEVQQRNAAAFENIRAKLGTALLPVFTLAAQTVNTTILPAVSHLADWLGKTLPGAISTVQGFLGGLTGKGSAFASVFAQIQSTGQAALPVIGQIISSLLDTARSVAPLIAQVATNSYAILQQILPSIGGVVSGVLGVIKAVAPVVVQVIGAVQAAIQQNLPAIKSAFQSIGQILHDLGALITEVWQRIGPIVLPIITSVFGTIVQVISGTLKIISGVIKLVLSLIRGDWSGAWNAIKQIVSGVWQIIKAVVLNAVKQIGTVVPRTLSAMKAGMSTVWGGIKAGVSSVWSFVKSWITSQISAAKSSLLGRLGEMKAGISGAWNAIKSATSNAWNTLVSTVRSKISSVLSAVRSLPGRAAAAVSALRGRMYSAGYSLISGLVSGIYARIGAAITAVRNGLSRIRSLLPGSPIKEGPLKSWNRGGAGKRLMLLLAGGIRDGAPAVLNQLDSVLSAVGSPTISPDLSGLSTSAARAVAASGAARAGTVVQVTVEAPVGSSGVEIGRQLVKYLREYGNSTGQRIVVG